MLFGAAEREALFSAQIAKPRSESLDRVLQESVTASQSLDPVNRVSYLESHFYMRNTLLRDSDFMSMAHGLELRVPFLDRALVEACFRIPGRQEATRGLAEEPAAGELGRRVAQGDRQSSQARIHSAV